MIDWNKPIETVDGRKARLIETNATEPGIWHIVYVSSIADPYGFGDVFIVNNEGYLCDDRTMGRKYSQEPFIRNAPVKREGWVNIYGVYETEEEAKRACVADTGRQRFVRWEE